MKFVLPVLVAAAGFVLGWLIWAGSPLFTGQVEPWDPPRYNAGYYPVGLILSGVLATFIAPRWYAWSGIGVFLGQGAFMTATLPPSPFEPLGLIMAASCSTLSAAGGWCVYRALRAWRERQ